MWIYSLIFLVIFITKMPSDFVSLFDVSDADGYESSDETPYSVVIDTNMTRWRKQQKVKARRGDPSDINSGLVPGQVAAAPRLFVPMKRTIITNNNEHHRMVQIQDLDMSITGLTTRVTHSNLTVPGQVDDHDQDSKQLCHVNNVYDFSAPPSASNSLVSLLSIHDIQEEVYIDGVDKDIDELNLADYLEHEEDIADVGYRNYMDSIIKRDEIWSGVYEWTKLVDIPDKKLAKMSPTKLLKLAVGAAENLVLADKDGTGSETHRSFLGALEDALASVTDFQEVLKNHPNPRYSTGNLRYLLNGDYGDSLAITYLKAFMTKVQGLFTATRKVATINKIMYESRTALEAALGQWTGRTLDTVQLRHDLQGKGIPRRYNSKELLTFFRVCAVNQAKRSNESKAEAKRDALSKLQSVRDTLTSLVNHFDRSSAWSTYDVTTVPMDGYDAPDIYLVAFVVKTQYKLDKAKDIKSKVKMAKAARKLIDLTIGKTKRRFNAIVHVEDATKTAKIAKVSKLRQSKQALDKLGKDHLLQKMMKDLKKKCKKSNQKQMRPVLMSLEKALATDLKSMKFLEDDLQNAIDMRSDFVSVIDNLPWEEQHRNVIISENHHTDEELDVMVHEVYQRALLHKLHLTLKQMDNPDRMIKMMSKSYIQVKETLDKVRKMTTNSS